MRRALISQRPHTIGSRVLQTSYSAKRALSLALGFWVFNSPFLLSRLLTQTFRLLMGPWGHSIKVKSVSFSKKRVLNRVLLAVRGENVGQFHVWEIESFGVASRMANFGDFENFRGPP